MYFSYYLSAVGSQVCDILFLFCVGLLASTVSLTLVDWIQVVVYIKQEIKLSC